MHLNKDDNGWQIGSFKDVHEKLKVEIKTTETI